MKAWQAHIYYSLSEKDADEVQNFYKKQNRK